MSPSSSSSSSKMYHSEKASRAALASVIVAILGSLMLLQSVSAMQLIDPAGGDQASIRTGPTASLAIVEYPEITARVLENLLRSIVLSANANELQSSNSGVQKRGLDLGISRGFSGSQAGKHLMGLSAASFANGPGR